MKYLTYVSVVVFALLLIYGSHGLPYRGDSTALVNREESLTGTPVASSYYIENAIKDANTDNMVTTVLGDYRSFDTLGEELVIFSAGMICYLLLRREKKRATRK